jgi:hypothetical protein
MSPWITTLIITTLLGSALVGGVFFAFSTFIMKALARVPSAEGIRAMQAINVVVINPAVMGVLIGTAILSAIIAVLTFVDGAGPLSPLRIRYLPCHRLWQCAVEQPSGDGFARGGRSAMVSISEQMDFLESYPNSRRHDRCVLFHRGAT